MNIDNYHRRIQTLMKERMPRRVNPRRISSPFLLSNIAFCGHCGKALVGKYAKSGNFSLGLSRISPWKVRGIFVLLPEISRAEYPLIPTI